MTSNIGLKTVSTDNSRYNQNIKKVYEMFDEQCHCPICLQVLVEPVTILCGHSYCLSCLKQFLQSSDISVGCPMCRVNLSYLQNNTIQINSILKYLLETRYGNEYFEKKLEVDQDRLESERKLSVMKKLLIGNHHALANIGQEVKMHRWTLYIRFADDEDEVDIGRFIKEITISTSETQLCTFNSAPYRFTATALQPFSININIEFHTNYNTANLQTEWNLCFTGIGNQKEIDLEFEV
ncbi:unnamed protein product [Didymodactylos carnosus]|uniref:RING-type domain-containing protein n=1 Tax=Didymodactylos carnosus TaxID=1234261 RepID=A0A814N877_9BILA|nr:unnamed protein product [Didymodactylos carnosus]CAF1233460.1 unnamed protein product [Didymodactylos carnosus]CAF3853954.1 unnamed protein product [Didymodactylos carnosus]CAF4041617.1 unnamed protein product [Didymodactylos carnosus]